MADDRKQLFQNFADKLEKATHRRAKNHGYELSNRLNLSQIKRIAKTLGISVIQLQGHDQWDNTVGGFYRVLIVAEGNDLDVQNNHQAILLEDCDSPHVSPSWDLYYNNRKLT